jgi:YVTN family beta-propeller protein
MTRPAATAIVAALAWASAHAAEQPSGYRVYATNEAAGTLTVIDGGTDKVLTTIALGKRPRGLCASPDGRLLYVALSGSPIGGPGVKEADLPPPDKAADGIGVVDLATGKISRTLKGVSDPEQVAVSPDGARLYVASEDAASLVTLDAKTGAVLNRLPVGDEPEGVAVSRDGKQVLVASEGDGSVSLVDARTGKLIARIPVGLRPRGVLFTPDGASAFVSEEAAGSVARLDLAKHAVARRLQLSDKNDKPMGLALSKDGRTLYVTTGRGGHVLAVDTKTFIPKALAATGPRPWGVSRSPDSRWIYTANGPADTVSVLDASTLRQKALIASAGKPWGVVALPP